MAEKSIVNDLKKIGRIITNPIGKSSLKKEKIVAVDIQIESITIALMQYGKKWKIERVLHKTFIPPDGDYPLSDHTGFYVRNLRSMLQSQKLVGLDGSIILPYSACKVHFFEMELLDDDELEEMIQDGSLNDQFNFLPKDIFNNPYSFNVLKRDEDHGNMQVILVVGDDKRLDNFRVILQRAGLNTVIMEPEVSSIINALYAQFGDKFYDKPTAYVINTEVYTYSMIVSKDGFTIYNINFEDADRVLLMHVEDIPDLEGEVWTEVFRRINGEIENQITKYNQKYQDNPVQEIFFISNRVSTKNFITGLNLNTLGLPVYSLDTLNNLKYSRKIRNYINKFENKSSFAKVIGAGINRFNFFDVKNKYEPFIKFNLLKNKEQIKLSRQLKALNKFFNYSILITLTTVACILGLLTYPIYQKNEDILVDYDQKKELFSNLSNENTSLSIKHKELKYYISLFGQHNMKQNISSLNLIHLHILKSVPNGLKIEELNYTPSMQTEEGNDIQTAKISVRGITIDENNLKFFMENLKKNKNLEIPDFGISASKTQSKNFNLLINILSDLDQESVI